MKRAFLLALTLLLTLQCFGNCTALAEETIGTAAEAGHASDAGMQFTDGMAQPILTYSAPDTPNDDSEILRLCVYVETDHDTDGDGMADLVKVFLQLPRLAAEGQYAAAAIYDPTPYPAGRNTPGIPNNNAGQALFEPARQVNRYSYNFSFTGFCSLDYNHLNNSGFEEVF